jgi:hypothetical protein
MTRTELLRPINDLGYLLECAALNYTGELKWELAALCARIRKREPGYDPDEVQAALPQLERSLTSCRSGLACEAVNLLSGVNRAWWSAVQP